ncbi:MAG: hypothetical protein A4E45_02014 [Methanosaeta sp. PtaB.Bin039]|nr:MAG: hypothetical protein A4E45_02014 [Methanosaeta sp. PtaB.Bin039]OPY46901.1 MAG: hypothetical protein A4E47_00426 [Methanosaeta sp. PtaU1.Bin028]HQF17645.1 hypothetical protein [Methanotrichaceae archaeon]HQI92233.1 hypothetical protein [Methanotrichaceae archaeon]
MKREAIVLGLIVVTLVGVTGAANYMYEKSNVKGVGYRNLEIVISTQHGFGGNKLVQKISGSGNVISSRIELEAERQLNYVGEPLAACDWPTGEPAMDYINYTSEQELEYMPVSYQTGTYDQKWIDKLCVQNYRIGAVMTEMYTHAEHLQKKSEIKTRSYGFGENALQTDCCTGVLEANLNAQVIGVAHIGWMSRDPEGSPLVKGRHIEYGRSVEDLTGVFSIEKFIQLWGNSTCGAISVDWLPCL